MFQPSPRALREDLNHLEVSAHNENDLSSSLIDRIDPDAVRVIERLTRHGHKAFLVGGSVRDLLLGRTPKDYDISTSAHPKEIRSVFRNSRLIGRRFRLAHVFFPGGKIFEVSTFRKDPSAEVIETEETTDLLIRDDNVFGTQEEDALRRDFRINGLFFDVESEKVIDFVDGLSDIENRIINTIGDPNIRFREDPVRMLRAVKFSSRLEMALAPHVLEAVTDARWELQKSARPRVYEEILRLLRSGTAHAAFTMCQELGLLDVFLPELASFLLDHPQGAKWFWASLHALDAFVEENGAPDDAVLVLMFLSGIVHEALHASNHKRSRFEAVLADTSEHFAIPKRVQERARWLWFQRGRAKKSPNNHRNADLHDFATILAETRHVFSDSQ